MTREAARRLLQAIETAQHVIERGGSCADAAAAAQRYGSAADGAESSEDGASAAEETEETELSNRLEKAVKLHSCVAVDAAQAAQSEEAAGDATASEAEDCSDAPGGVCEEENLGVDEAAAWNDAQRSALQRWGV